MTITQTSVRVLDGPIVGHRAQTRLLTRAWPWLIVAAAGLTTFFGGALTSLSAAWQRPEYSYGPLVPLITAAMIMRELHRQVPSTDSGSRLPGVALVCTGLSVGLLGNLAGIANVGTYGFILAIAGFILILAGLRNGLRLLPVAALLLFMLQLPQFVFLQLSTTLQSRSSQLGVGFIDAMGIPVLLDGNFIDLGTYKTAGR